MEGIGHGAEALGILNKMAPHQALFVTESDPLKLNLALRLHDFSKYLRAGRLVLLLGDDSARLLEDFFHAHLGYNIVNQSVTRTWLTDQANQLYAQQLTRAGHRVTVFEKGEKPGGLLRYGIPDFKLEKRIIDRRLEQMRLEGAEFQTGVAVGQDISARYLDRTFDAVCLTTGAGQPRDLNVPGRNLEGIHFAMDFLAQQNRVNAGDLPADDPDNIVVRDKVVVVIAAGDTASGASLVVRAIYAGRQAAEGIDR
jgi:hypothetical protein